MIELNRGMKSYSGDVIDQTLHSPFDIETHKDVFVNYLEVIIDQEGVVHYVVPSHQEWLINKAIVVLGLSSREELCEHFSEIKDVDLLPRFSGDRIISFDLCKRQ